jgi:hypothetical protein
VSGEGTVDEPASNGGGCPIGKRPAIGYVPFAVKGKRERNECKVRSNEGVRAKRC